MALELTIENIDAGYGAVRALQGVSMHVGNGETAALLGTNGNGKSTLMKCVMGMVRPTRGTVTLAIDGVRHGAKAEPLAVVGEVHEHGKSQSHGEPDRRPGEGLLDADDVGLAMKYAQV